MSYFKPGIRRSSRVGYVRGIRGRNYPRRKKAPARRYVPRTMGPFSVSESKYFDSTRAAVAIPEVSAWTGTELDPSTINTLVCPQEGSDIDNRVGRKIQVYKLAIRGVMEHTALQDQTDIITNPAIRLILYMDEQTNGVQAQGEDLMEATTGSPQGVFTGFQNKANFGRFRVLRDKIFYPRDVSSMTDGANTSSQNAVAIPFKMTVKFRKPVVIKFNATNGGTVGDIVDNSFHLIGCKSGTGFATVLTYTCRSYYKDH